MEPEDIEEASDLQFAGRSEESTVDINRALNDSRVLICEGRCNPLLREYDGLVERYGAEPVIATLKYIMLRVRQLVYTRHERCRGEHWDPKHGWIRSFRCQVCGAVKKF